MRYGLPQTDLSKNGYKSLFVSRGVKWLQGCYAVIISTSGPHMGPNVNQDISLILQSWYSKKPIPLIGAQPCIGSFLQSLPESAPSTLKLYIYHMAQSLIDVETKYQAARRLKMYDTASF